MSEQTEPGGVAFWGGVDDAEALERYRALVDAVDDGIYHLDSEGLIVGVNETLVERTGFSREELLGEHFSTLLVGAGTRNVGDVVGDLVETGGNGRGESVECPVRVVGTESVDCEHRLTPIPETAAGDPGVIGVVRLPEPDPLVEAEPAPTFPDDTLASILDEADAVGVFVLDADVNVAWIDGTTEEYFGLDRESVVGRDKRQLVEETISACIDDEETFTETVFATYDDNTYLEQFECHVMPGDDREERWLEHLSKPIDSGPYAGGRVEIYYDVTEQHRRASQLRQLNEAVREWLTETSREAVAERACAHLSDILDLEINGVFLHDAATDELRPASLSKPGESLIEEPPTFTTEDSIAGRVFRTGEQVVYDDVTSDPDVYNPDTPIRSEIVLPIGDHGVVIIGSESRNAFDDVDLMLAKVVASSLESTFDRISHERQLQRERDLVDRILETSPVGILVLDKNGEVTLMNERLTELLDVEDSDDFDPVDQRIYAEDGPPIPITEHPFARTVATGEPVYDEVLQIELSGDERRWLSINATPVMTDEGEIDRVVISGQDITALKEREHRLERQRDDLAAELEEIYGRITDGFVALNEDWELTHLNERAEEILDVDEDEMLGRAVWEARPEIRDTVFEERYREAMNTQESVSFVAYHDRTDAWYEEHVYPSETGLSVYFRDVTERKEIERELRESERRFRQIAENIEAVVWLTPPDKSEMTYINPAYEDIWGRSRQLLYEEPTSFLAAIHPEDRDRVQAALETQVDGEYDEEYRVVQPDGEVRWVRDRAFPVEDDGEVYRIVGIAEDVTERKAREDELREKERGYQAIFNDPNILVGLLEPDGTVGDVNQTAMEYVEADLAAVTGEPFWETPWWGEGDDVESEVREWTERAADGEYVDFEADLTRPDGERYTLSGYFRPVIDDDGEVVSIIVSDRDVTERRQRERELERSERRYRTLAEYFPNGVVTLFDRDLRYELVAGQGFDGISVEPDDVTGHHFSEVWDDETVAALEPAFQAALDGEETSVELTYEDRDWVIHTVPITDERGDVFAGMATAQDITDQKERERELERTLDLLERTERIADVGGWEVDPETREPYWSDHLFELLDVDFDHQPSLEEALDVYHTEADRETFEETVEEALETGEPFDLVVRFPRPEGDVGWLRVQGDPEVGNGEVVTLRGAVQDVTERKERERRLEELIDKLEESNERLEQFAYAASHDLQEPLRMVSSYLQLLERRYGDELDEDAEEFLDFAVDGANRMREMIDGLLEYSRVDTRGDPLAPVDLEAVLEDVREDLRLQIRETDAEIVAEDLPRVEGDPSQLRQVFQNLLENAIEYSGDHPPRVHVGAERNGDQWMVSVTDQGIGIDPDDHDRVFEVFQRLHTHEKHEGTGIGLALCERIVERHGGDIWIDSEPGEETTFSVTLPAVDGFRA